MVLDAGRASSCHSYPLQPRSLIVGLGRLAALSRAGSRACCRLRSGSGSAGGTSIPSSRWVCPGTVGRVKTQLVWICVCLSPSWALAVRAGGSRACPAWRRQTRSPASGRREESRAESRPRVGRAPAWGMCARTRCPLRSNGASAAWAGVAGSCGPAYAPTAAASPVQSAGRYVAARAPLRCSASPDCS
jgi:hypothetical protein